MKGVPNVPVTCEVTGTYARDKGEESCYFMSP